MVNRVSRTLLLFCCVVTLHCSRAQETVLPAFTDSIIARLHGYQDKGVQDSAIYYMDLWVQSQIARGAGVVPAHCSKISLLLTYKQYDEAFRVAMSVYEEYCSGELEKKQCRQCLRIYEFLTDFMNSMGRYREGLRFMKMRCGGFKPHSYDYHLAVQYLKIGDRDSAEIIIRQPLESARASGSKKQLYRAYNQEGLVFRKAGDFSKAKKSFLNALAIGTELGFSDEKMYFVYGNLGSSYLRLNQLDSARQWLAWDAARSLDIGDFPSFTIAEVSLAEIDLAERRGNEAARRLQMLLNKYSGYIHMDYAVRMDSLIAIYTKDYTGSKLDKLGNQWSDYVKDRYENEHKAEREFESAFQSKILEQAYLQIQNEKELAKQKLVVLESERDSEQLRSLLLLSLAGGIAAIILLAFWRFRSIHKRKAIIDRMRLDISEKEREILELRVAEESDSVKRLALELNAKKEFSGALMAKLGELDGISPSELRNMEMFIQNELDVRSARVEVEQDLDEVSKKFYLSLKRAFPKLTEADLKLASLVILKASNKEIAISRNITPNSVKITKNRLKKKLNLTPGDDLYAYLNTYL